MNEVTVEIDTPILGGDIPAGGSTGEVLTKRSDMDLDYGWEPISQPEGVELKSNKVQSIGEGSATEYPSTNAVKTFVDAGLSSKQDAVAGKGLSTNDFTDADKAKLGAAITDAPMTGLMYGRESGLWKPIALVSALAVTINHPNDVFDSDYTIVVGAAGAEERYTYTGAGMAISVPAGVRVTVLFNAPTGFTAPRSLIYNSVLGVTRIYGGTSIAIVAGIYILSKDGTYTPWRSWETQLNSEAVGVGVMSSQVSFVVAKKFGSMTNPEIGSDTGVHLFWGQNNVDCASLGMVGASSVEDAFLVGLEHFQENNRILLERHSIGQPNWLTDESITNLATENYAPAAASAARFAPSGNDAGVWGLPTGDMVKYCWDNKESTTELMRAFAYIGGSGELTMLSCIPKDDNIAVFFSFYASNLVSIDRNQQTSQFSKVRPFRLF